MDRCRDTNILFVCYSSWGHGCSGQLQQIPQWFSQVRFIFSHFKKRLNFKRKQIYATKQIQSFMFLLLHWRIKVDFQMVHLFMVIFVTILCCRQCIAIACVNSFSSLYAGIVVFSTLGFMAKQQGVSVGEVAESGENNWLFGTWSIREKLYVGEDGLWGKWDLKSKLLGIIWNMFLSKNIEIKNIFSTSTCLWEELHWWQKMSAWHI